MIHANHTDIVIMSSVMPSLMQLGLENMWVRREDKMDPNTWVGFSHRTSENTWILFFHAFSGCDLVSSFHGKSKKSAWKTWDVCDEVSDTFARLSKCPSAVEDSDLERCVVLMFDRSCDVTTVTGPGQSCSLMFDRSSHNCEWGQAWSLCRKAQTIWLHPPTRAALKEPNVLLMRLDTCGDRHWSDIHKYRAHPTGDGWTGWVEQDEEWKVFWTPLSPIAESWELTQCGCTKACTGRCKCFRYGLSCTCLCSCPC